MSTPAADGRTTARRLRRARPVLFVLLALPALWIVWQWAAFASGLPHDLGFNPQETSNRFLGIQALRGLLLALAVTPLARLLGKPWPLAFRRMIGLYAFFYAALHLCGYVALDLVFDWRAFVEEVVERNFITLGLAAFLLLLPLALTSTRAAVRRLGARRWQSLHRLVYPAGAMAALHYTMLAKGNRLEPLIYAAAMAILLGVRLIPKGTWRRARRG